MGMYDFLIKQFCFSANGQSRKKKGGMEKEEQKNVSYDLAGTVSTAFHTVDNFFL